jgi:hypothetical protein
MRNEIKFTDEQLDMLVTLIRNELEYYERKEDIYPEDEEYIAELKKILEKVWR